MTVSTRKLTHPPRRPEWLCDTCPDARAWPCRPAQVELADRYAGDRIGLAVYVGMQLDHATREMPTADPGDLYDRFVAWTRSGAAVRDLARLTEVLSRYHVEPALADVAALADRVAEARRANDLDLGELADLITAAQQHQAATTVPSPAADRAACLLGQAYRLAADVLRPAGAVELARLAADRAYATGGACGCPMHGTGVTR